MKNNSGVIKALAYSDIFDYPLTLEEVHKFYMGDRKESIESTKKILDTTPEISRKNDLYFLNGRDSIVVTRQIREVLSQEKMRKARRIAKILSIFPTIQLVAISGSLALKNSGPDDDIDFFIVTSDRTVWLTRFATVLVLILLGQKRKKGSRFAPDKICPNMFISERCVTVPESARSIYTAREITQILPLVTKNRMYERLQLKNEWVKKFLPNFRIPKRAQTKAQVKKLPHILKVIDVVLFYLQRAYMKRVTNEIVTIDIAKFHPRDTSKYVLALFKSRVDNIESSKHSPIFRKVEVRNDSITLN